MRTTRTMLQAALAYFAIVFGAGFVLGTIRVIALVPRLGPRMAELLEMPIMLAVILRAASFVTSHFALPRDARVRLGTGVIALLLLITAEVVLAVALQGRSLGAYIASRDPVSGTVYLAMLVFFALLPYLLARARPAARG